MSQLNILGFQTLTQVIDDLAQLVRQVADRHPVLAMRCGKGMKLRRSWLDIDFPFAAPPEFVRSG